VFLEKDRTMDNVQEHNICSSLTSCHSALNRLDCESNVKIMHARNKWHCIPKGVLKIEAAGSTEMLATVYIASHRRRWGNFSVFVAQS
jgi:hypothetical protein